MQPVQDLTIEDRVSRTQYQFTLGSPNLDDLNTWAPKLVDKLNERKELSDVASDLQSKGLQAYLDIDRDTAGRLGITPAAIDQILYDAFGQRLISTIYTESNQYRVVLEVLPEMQNGPKALSKIYIPGLSNANSVAQTSQGSTASAGNASASSAFGGTPQGATPGITTGLTAAAVSNGQLPLDTVTTLSERAAPLSISHLGQFPATTVSFNLAQGYSLGDAVEAIKQVETDLKIPASVSTNFQGAALAFQASLTNTVLLILAAIVTMYIVLGVLYESYIHPITILSTLPSAGIGALLALMIARDDLGIVAIIGIILLIGIVKKNAIMMVDFALDAERNQGMAPREAIYQACLLRFRPILMTTLAALFGALPLMLGTGVGSELRHPLGITIVGGMIVSQVLTLFTTPVIYLSFDHSRDARAQTFQSCRTRNASRCPGRRGDDMNPRLASLSAPFVKRPVATTLLTIGIALAGFVSFSLLPVSPLPQVDFPTISVSASLPGASPETMSTSVATPLERQLGRIAGVTEMTSIERAEFHARHAAIRSVARHRWRRARRAGRTQRRAGAVADRADQSDVSQSKSRRSADPDSRPHVENVEHRTNLRRRIDCRRAKDFAGERRRPGHGERRDVAGRARRRESDRAQQIRHRARHRSHRAAERQREPAERIHRAGRQTLAALHERSDRTRFRTVQKSDRHLEQRRRCAPVRCRRCHRFRAGHPQPRLVQRYAGGVDPDQQAAEREHHRDHRRSDGAVARSCARRFRRTSTINVAVDRTTTIRASLHDVEQTLFISVLLVVLVVFVFLRNWRATLIPAVAVPVSLIGTFAAMYLCGYSLNILSLMALTVATGFVVDDAVVVLENISRHIEDGMARMQAVLLGAREVGFTVVSMSLSLIAVFIPILLMGGLVGRYFREFAVTLSVAILVSLVVSLTTTPMICSRVLRHDPNKKHGRAYEMSERAFKGMIGVYERTLGWALARPLLMMFILLVTVCLNVYLYIIVPKGFFPTEDTGVLVGGVQADQSISFQSMSGKMVDFMNIVKSDPAVQTVAGFTGGGQRNGGFMFVALKPLKERGISARRRDQPPARKTQRRARRAIVPAGRAGHPHRRPAEPTRRINTHCAAIASTICACGATKCARHLRTCRNWRT